MRLVGTIRCARSIHEEHSCSDRVTPKTNDSSWVNLKRIFNQKTRTTYEPGVVVQLTFPSSRSTNFSFATNVTRRNLDVFSARRTTCETLSLDGTSYQTGCITRTNWSYPVSNWIPSSEPDFFAFPLEFSFRGYTRGARGRARQRASQSGRGDARRQGVTKGGRGDERRRTGEATRRSWRGPSRTT